MEMFLILTFNLKNYNDIIYKHYEQMYLFLTDYMVPKEAKDI